MYTKATLTNCTFSKIQHGSFFTLPIPFQAVYNSGKATIQARLIILELTRILASHRWRFAMNLNLSGASDSFFFQWCPNLEEAEDAARYCAIILSRWVGLQEFGSGGIVSSRFMHITYCHSAHQRGFTSRTSAAPCQQIIAMCPIHIFICGLIHKISLKQRP